MELPAPRKNIRSEVALTFEGSGVTVRAVAENILRRECSSALR